MGFQIYKYFPCVDQQGNITGVEFESNVEDEFNPQLAGQTITFPDLFPGACFSILLEGPSIEPIPVNNYYTIDWSTEPYTLYANCPNCIADINYVDQCLCSDVENNLGFAETWRYIDCNGDLNSTLELQPGEISPKLCVREWINNNGNIQYYGDCIEGQCPTTILYAQMISCCDPEIIIYANVLGYDDSYDNGVYGYSFQDLQASNAGCYTINFLSELPTGVEPVLDLDVNDLESRLVGSEERITCEADICVALCSPCLCTRARIIPGTSLPPSDISILILDCNNELQKYDVPANGSFGESVCAKFIESSSGDYQFEIENTGGCLFDERTGEYECFVPPSDNSYELRNCNDSDSVIITNFDLSQVVGQVITLRDENNKPLEGCWEVFLIDFQIVEEDVVLGVYKCFEDCEDCLPIIPEPCPTVPRSVYPNYTTGNCDPDIVEAAFCKNGENQHKKVLNKRFGIKDCCPENEEKLYIDNEKIKLALLTSNNPAPDPCNEDPIINEYYLARVDGASELTLSYIDSQGVSVSFIIPACISDCEPVRFCAVRGSILFDLVLTYAANEGCTSNGVCVTNENLVFVRPCILN